MSRKPTMLFDRLRSYGVAPERRARAAPAPGARRLLGGVDDVLEAVRESLESRLLDEPPRPQRQFEVVQGIGPVRQGGVQPRTVSRSASFPEASRLIRRHPRAHAAPPDARAARGHGPCTARNRRSEARILSGALSA